MSRTKHTHVVSSTPERTRLRLSAKRRTEEEMRRIARSLEAKPEVHEVLANALTGSIIVRHAPGALGDIRATLRDLGVVLASSAGIDVSKVEGKTDIVCSLSDAVADLNRRLRLPESGWFNLRTLIPAGFGALSVLQLLRCGLQIQAAPWYFLAYLSFDSFVKLNSSIENCELPDSPDAGDEL